MSVWTDEDYQRLCAKIEASDREASLREAKMRDLARCVALCVREAATARGRTLKEGFKLCGTVQAALGSYLMLAYDPEQAARLAPLFENAEEILPEIAALELEE